MPKMKINENNQEREVDDVDRSLRFAAEAMIAAEEAAREREAVRDAA